MVAGEVADDDVASIASMPPFGLGKDAGVHLFDGLGFALGRQGRIDVGGPAFRETGVRPQQDAVGGVLDNQSRA
jgi:hypothetical protein